MSVVYKRNRGKRENMGFFDLFKRQKPIDLIALQRDLEILNDCAQLIENTVNPETFFSRYDLYMQKLAVSAEAQASHRVKVQGDNLVQKYERMNTDKQKVETINAFIDRMWADTRQKADKLKTEKGKENRFNKFVESLSVYNERMPAQCIEHYNTLFSDAPRIAAKNRNKIDADKIDKMQRIAASDAYREQIYKKYYRHYPEKPYISQDREFNTNWMEQAEMFREQSIIPKSMMSRFSDGLLPGHVYMLYWTDKIHRKRIPAYFEYEFGIDFEKEKLFLQENGYLDSENRLTEKGRQAISSHYDVVENKK